MGLIDINFDKLIEEIKQEIMPQLSTDLALIVEKAIREDLKTLLIGRTITIKIE